MLTTGRFLICLIVLVCLFVIAWNLDIDIQQLIQGDSKDPQLAQDAPAGLLDSNSEVPVSGAQKPDADSVWQKRAGNPGVPQDFSSIAISDPLSNHFSKHSRQPNGSQSVPRSTGERATLPTHSFAPSTTRFDSVPIDQQWEQAMRQKQNSVEGQPRPLETESKLSFSSVDPPPPVADMNANGLTGQLQQTPNVLGPKIPDLRQKIASDRDLAMNGAGPGPPNALRSVDRGNEPLVGNHAVTSDFRDPGNSPPADGHLGQLGHLGQVGTLVVVNKSARMSDRQKKPIGFVKHTWKADDSLPELALSYLGRRDLYMEIVRLNSSQLKDPNAIRPGTVLRIPVY